MKPMKYRSDFKSSVLAALLFLFLVSLGCVDMTQAPVDDIALLAHRDVFASISYGTGDGQIGMIPHSVEKMPKGPESIAINGAGDIFILDRINSKVLRYNNRGQNIAAVAVDSLSLNMVVSKNRIFTVTPSHIFAYSFGGELKSVCKIPKNVGIPSSIRVTNDNLFFLVNHNQDSFLFKEIDSPYRLVFVEKTEGIISKVSGQRLKTNKIDEHTFSLANLSANNQIIFKTKDRLGSAVLAGFDHIDNRYLLVETLVAINPLLVKRYVLSFDSDNRILGSINIPFEYYSFPRTDLAVAPDGTIYQLSPEKNKDKIYKARNDGGRIDE